MRYLIGCVLLGMLVGCAQQPVRTDNDGSGNAFGVARGELNQRARIHGELAAQYYALGKYAVALEEVKESLDADGGHAPAYHILGLVRSELKEDAEAEAAFRRALDLVPQFSDARNSYGGFLCKRQRYNEAFAQFEAAIKNPLYDHPEVALANAGLCAIRQGDLAKAEDYLEQSLRRVPNQPQAILAMVELHTRLGNPLGARHRLRQLEGMVPLNASALWMGLLAERKLGNKDGEADYGIRLRRNFPEARETRWLLNGQYDMLGGTP